MTNVKVKTKYIKKRNKYINGAGGDRWNKKKRNYKKECEHENGLSV
jgi:hypothetical protein